MKNCYMLVSLLLISTCGFAQDTLPKRQPLKPIKSESSVQPTKTLGTPAKEEMSVEQIDKRIAAIDLKVNHVKSDEAQNKRALESGWFDQMAKNRQELVDRKALLLKTK